MAANGISILATKELRQKAKLDLASLKRQGYTLNADGTIASSVTPATTPSIQNVAGSDGPEAFFFRPDNSTYAQIVAGWTVVGQPTWVVTSATSDPDDQYSTAVTITGGTFVSGQSYAFTGNIVTAGAPDTGAPFYRARGTYDITQLPTQYDGNAIIDNPNVGGLVVGRPWTYAPFTFYEAFGTITALSTTQYVSGNKIYVHSSTFDVPNYQNAVIAVNDVEVYNNGSRGHTLAILDSSGNTISITTYDTYDGPTGEAQLTALASALSGVASGNIVVLTVWDASALNAAVRTAINTEYGSTNSNTWISSRVDHIFIGIKI